MLIIHRARRVVREIIVLRRLPRLPVVPRALRIDRIHPAKLFDAFAKGILFSHTLQHTKRQRGTVTVTDFVVACPAASTAVIVIV